MGDWNAVVLTLDLSQSTCLKHIGQHSFATSNCPLPYFWLHPSACSISSDHLKLLLSRSFLVVLVFFFHILATNSKLVLRFGCHPFKNMPQPSHAAFSLLVSPPISPFLSDTLSFRYSLCPAIPLQEFFSVI